MQPRRTDSAANLNSCRWNEAFVLSAELDGDGALVARWNIEDGYYLYRHRFVFKTREGERAQVGEVTIPPGKAKVDEYSGRSRFTTARPG